MARSALVLFLSILLAGCQTPLSSITATSRPEDCPILAKQRATKANKVTAPKEDVSLIRQAAWQAESEAASESETPDSETPPLSLPTEEPGENQGESIQLRDVISSVLNTFPLVQAAALQFDVAQGQVLSAEGAFDTKLKSSSENGPLGFYETYRHSAGAVQPLAFGGEVFGGYRVGRGVFQPWYQERQTNEGGEFKAGISVPLSRNVDIDSRRAGVRKANLALFAADPQFLSLIHI